MRNPMSKTYHKQLSADTKMYNYKIKTSFVSPEMTKETGYYTIQYMVFQYGLETFLIQRIVIGFEAILELYIILTN